MQRRNAPHWSGEIRNRGRLNIISRQDLFQFIKFSNYGSELINLGPSSCFQRYSCLKTPGLLLKEKNKKRVEDLTIFIKAIRLLYFPSGSTLIEWHHHRISQKIMILLKWRSAGEEPGAMKIIILIRIQKSPNSLSIPRHPTLQATFT